MIQEKNKNEIACKNGDISLETLLSTKDTQNIIVQRLGKNRLQTFLGNALTVAQDSKFADTEPTSLFNCLLKTAVYNFPLDSSIGYSYIIPYKNKDGLKIAQFQMGAKGFIEMAYRTNKYSRLNVCDVKETELLGKDWFGEVEIKWDNSEDRDKLKTVGYLAAFELTNGMRKREYWSVKDIENHALKYSKAHQYALNKNKKDDDLWQTSFNSMSEKTVLKSLISKYGPKSMELQDAIKFDQSVIHYNGNEETPEYIDNEEGFSDINENIIFDIDDNGEVTQKETKNKEVEKVNTIVEDKECFEIDYATEYKPNKSKYIQMVRPDGSKSYSTTTKKIYVKLA